VVWRLCPETLFAAVAARNEDETPIVALSVIDWYEVFSGRYADGIFKNMIKGDSNKPGMETILNIISMGSTFRT